MNCTRCKKRIARGEKYRRTKLGSHHIKCPATPLWVVMRAFRWGTTKVNGITMDELMILMGGPKKFLPLFESREEAVAFEKGSDAYVCEFRGMRP